MRDASYRHSVGCGQNLLATSHRSLAGSKTPTPALPQGEGAYMRATNHGLIFCLPLWGRWPQAGGGLLGGVWEVGK